MITNRLKPSVHVLSILAAATLAACASTPTTTAQLESAQRAYRQAASDAQVSSTAPIQLREAEESLRRAERLLQDEAAPARVDHYAYLAERRTAIAVETARLAAAEQAVRRAGDERDRLLIDSRTREADVATQRAAEETRRAQTARALAESRLKEAEAARAQSEAARAQAVAAQAQASASSQKARSLEMQLAELKAQQTDRGLVLTLGDVLFDSGKATLKPGALRTIDQLAAFLRDQDGRKVLIEGHTDSRGSEDANQRLSDERAAAVRYTLLDRRIGADRVYSRGYGESYPVASNETPAGRQQNRRVEVVVSDESGKLPDARR